MDIAPPRPKKNCRLHKSKPLPIILKKNGEVHKFKGIFDGFSVKITDRNDMRSIVSMGYFGKASLSKSFPQFDGTFEKPETIRQRQLERRKRWPESKDPKDRRKILVVPDSDDEYDDYFKNLKVSYEIDKCGDKETTNLMLEEAFFLQNDLNCLEICYENETLSVSKTWQLFSESDSLFQQKYAVYYHFRSKNWVVKPGMKFGGEYLLYKEGPPFYHASYVVIIKNQADEEPINTTNMIGLQRMCETAGKELLICSISAPNQYISPDELSDISIKEILVKRWVASQEREENT